jgi:hypothetical protein
MEPLDPPEELEELELDPGEPDDPDELDEPEELDELDEPDELPEELLEEVDEPEELLDELELEELDPDELLEELDEVEEVDEVDGGDPPVPELPPEQAATTRVDTSALSTNRKRRTWHRASVRRWPVPSPSAQSSSLIKTHPEVDWVAGAVPAREAQCMWCPYAAAKHYAKVGRVTTTPRLICQITRPEDAGANSSPDLRCRRRLDVFRAENDETARDEIEEGAGQHP